MPTIQSDDTITPLAAKLRPQKLDDIVGQDHLIGDGKPLQKMVERNVYQSIIFWGPPGTGKTTIVRTLANETGSIFRQLNATNASVKELRAIIKTATESLKENQRTFVFIDECLPYNCLVFARINNKVQYIPIGELVEQAIECEVLSVAADGAREWKRVVSWSKKDQQPLIEINISGQRLVCSNSHRVFTTNRGYVRADELCVGDNVVILKDKEKEDHGYATPQNLSQVSE